MPSQAKRHQQRQRRQAAHEPPAQPTRQELVIDVPVPPLGNSRAKQLYGVAKRNRQQAEVRRMLDLLAHRPQMPCRISLVRLSGKRLDSDGAIAALKYVRDAIARWAHGLPETIPALDKTGRPMFTAAGKLKTTKPPAPDGPGDGIEWIYPPGELGRRIEGPKRATRLQGVRITIEGVTP